MILRYDAIINLLLSSGSHAWSPGCRGGATVLELGSIDPDDFGPNSRTYSLGWKNNTEYQWKTNLTPATPFTCAWVHAQIHKSRPKTHTSTRSPRCATVAWFLVKTFYIARRRHLFLFFAKFPMVRASASAVSTPGSPAIPRRNSPLYENQWFVQHNL
jgi:hypothetical protein